MARKRMIDPGIWVSEDFSNLSMIARLIWVGLISNADDEGRGKANAAYLKSQLFPYDDELPLKKVESALKEIEDSMSIQFYEVDKKKYYQLTKWDKFQKIDRPSASQIPAFTANNDDTNHIELAIVDSSQSEQIESSERILDEHSSNNNRTLDEQSSTKYKYKQEKEYEYLFVNNNGCACVREGKEESAELAREPYKAYFNDFFDYYQSGEFYDVALGVVDSLIMAKERAQVQGFKFYYQVYSDDDLIEIYSKLDYEKFKGIVEQVKFNKNIVDKFRYIMGCVFKSCETASINPETKIRKFKESLKDGGD